MADINYIQVKGKKYKLLEVEANPTLSDENPSLNGLEIDGIKYVVKKQKYLVDILFDTGSIGYYKCSFSIITDEVITSALELVEWLYKKGYTSVETRLPTINPSLTYYSDITDPKITVGYNSIFFVYATYQQSQQGVWYYKLYTIEGNPITRNYNLNRPGDPAFYLEDAVIRSCTPIDL